MGKTTGIEWCEHTFNGVLGCTKVSEACKHCYAENEHPVRINRSQGIELWGPGAQRRSASESMWDQLYQWNRKAEKDQEYRRVFCYSMGDVFEDNPVQLINDKGKPLFYSIHDRNELTGEPIVFTTRDTGRPVTHDTVRYRLFRAIRKCTALIFLLLTKRPENVHRMIPRSYKGGNWPHNIWLGTTTENQNRYFERIPWLIRSGAKTKFISAEPLLGPLDLQLWGDEIDWVIAGGESRRKGEEEDAAIMQQEWVRNLRDQCFDHDIPFFFKQWGDWIPTSQLSDQDTSKGYNLCAVDDGKTSEFYICMGKRHTGSMLDGEHHKADPLSHLIESK